MCCAIIEVTIFIDITKPEYLTGPFHGESVAIPDITLELMRYADKYGCVSNEAHRIENSVDLSVYDNGQVLKHLMPARINQNNNNHNHTEKNTNRTDKSAPDKRLVFIIMVFPEMGYSNAVSYLLPTNISYISAISPSNHFLLPVQFISFPF